MNRRTTVPILLACGLALLAPPPAFADYVGLEVVDRSDLSICKDPSEPDIPFKLDVCDIHVVFDDDADRLISVAFSNVSTTASQGFFQHTMNPTNTAPSCPFVALFPTLVCDSFVTLGVECFDFVDNSIIDPDFDAAGFNFSGEVSGGWFNSAPANGQGDPDANGRVMISRFSYKQNKNTSGDVCVFTQLAGSLDIIAFLLQPFDCSVPGGGLPSAGGPACGDPGTGSCFQQNSGTPFCNCAACCDLICNVGVPPDIDPDPYCCDTDWDSSCQQSACANCDFTACEDCNSNGIFDSCDVDCLGGSPCIVCNDVPGCGESPDCNSNNVPDECDMDPTDPDNNGEVSEDCNSNTKPDECDIDPTDPDENGEVSEDCNSNGIPDECDIASGKSTDVDGNGVPDECQEDCNSNGVFDLIDIADGTSEDCNENMVPDECEAITRGPIFLSGHDADAGDHCWGTPGVCGDLYGQLLEIAVNDSQIDTGENKRLLAIGVNGWPDSSPAALALAWFNNTDNKGPGVGVEFDLDVVTDPVVIGDPLALNFAEYSAIYIPSIANETAGGITADQLEALSLRQADIENFVNELHGGLLALTEKDVPFAYAWLPVPLVTDLGGHDAACPTETLNLILDVPINCDDLTVDVGPYHNIFTGPPGFLGLSVLVVSNDNTLGEALILGELDSRLMFDCDGDGTPDSCQCPWDSNGDGTVGAFDLAFLLGNWGPLGVGNPARCLDADGDGEIGPFDLAHLLGNWGPCPP